MTNAQGQAGQAAQPAAGATLSRSAATGDWVATRYADVQEILADERLEVPAVSETAAAPGSVAWLRASVCRFANGSEHERRRASAVSELARLDPAALRDRAHELARAELAAAGGAGHRVDVMARLAREVPMAALAGALGAADAEQAAEAVIAVAAGYFGTADDRVRQAADAGTARLLTLFEPASMLVKVARITLLAQGCDAVAGLIGAALHELADAGGARPGPGWPTDAVLAEVLRFSPPVRAIRRVARAAADHGGARLPAGSVLISSVESANRDAAAFADPDRFDPARSGPPSLTFGWGIRPCPGQAEALALAAGVIDAVLDRCDLLPGQPVEHVSGSPLRIPRHLEVVLR